MAKFHIREDGTPGRCWAKPGNCPVSRTDEDTEAPHYGSKEEARSAYESKMENEIVHGAVQKDGTRKHPLAGIPDLGTRESSKAVRLTMEAVDSVSDETLERWRKLDQNAPEHRIAREIDDFRKGAYTEGVLTNLAASHGTVAYAYADKDLKALAKEKVELETAEEINALHDSITSKNREILAESGIATYDGFKVNNFGLEKVEVNPERKAEVEREIARISQDLPVLKKLHEAWSTPSNMS